jgi:hypothetical protein
VKVKQLALRLDKQDYEILDRLALFEKLTQSDVLRRALRAYAHQLGIIDTPRPPKISSGVVRSRK